MTDSGAAAMSGPRVLLAITAYNGEAFIARTLDSALHIDQGDAQLDVLVLDDCSPAPGFSHRLAALCEQRGILYYRSPRNLGIPRNVSLGLLTAVQQGYDYVIISNSDVIYPRNFVTQLLAAVAHDGVGLGDGLVEQRVDVLHAQRRPRPLPGRPGPRRLAQRDPRRASTPTPPWTSRPASRSR